MATSSIPPSRPSIVAKALSHEPLVIREQDPDRIAPGLARRLAVRQAQLDAEAVGVGAANSSPPSSSARSRIPVNPYPPPETQAGTGGAGPPSA